MINDVCKELEIFKGQGQQVNKELERLKPFLEQLAE